MESRHPNIVHGLPDHVNQLALIPDPDKRRHHWLHAPTGETFHLHPDYPNAPKESPVASTFLQGSFALAAPRSEYIVLLPGGKTARVNDLESASALAALIYGDTEATSGIAEDKIVETEAEPTPEEIAAQQARIREMEAQEQAEIAAATTQERSQGAKALAKAVKESGAKAKAEAATR